MDYCEVRIHNLLQKLGITANYKGYFYIKYALRLCLEDPGSLQLITKWLYPEVAKRYSTTWTAVERSVRTAIAVAWNRSPSYLSSLARFPLQTRPKAAQFFAILTADLAWGS